MPTTAKKPKRSGKTAGQIFHRLIEAILSGKLPSGRVVREARLAREWKVSRTPLREAMRRAAETGFIVLRPNHAPAIRLLSRDDVRELYELRELLELRALALSWTRVTPAQIQSLQALAARAKPDQERKWMRRCLDFDLALHGLWTRGCGNHWLAADLERYYQFLRIFQSWIARDPTPWPRPTRNTSVF